MSEQLDALCTRIDVYLNDDSDDGDGDALMALLEAAIAAHPGQARLFALRARMHATAYCILDAADDWEQALRLAPHDRIAALELARLRLRRADRLAEMAVRREKAAASPGQQAQDDEDDWDEADDARAAVLSAQFETGATRALRKLMREHVADLDFALLLLDAMDELCALSPWVHYALLLQALAAHPGITELKTREARFLVSLASHCGVDSEAIPAGYLETFSGQRYHVVTLGRALRAIDAAIAIAPDAALLSSKGELLTAMERYQDAAAAYAQAAGLFDAAADDDAIERAGAARKQESLCRQGRGALIEDQFAMVDGAMEQLAELQRSMGNEPDPGQEEMKSSMAQCRDSLEAVADGPDAQQQAEYERMAESVAQQTVNLISFEPVVLQSIAQAGLVGGLSPWYAAIGGELAAAGLGFRFQFDNPSNTRLLGMQCQGQLWTDADGGSALVAETVRSLTLKRLVTELSDHSFIMTADDRARSFWEYGPSIDPMSVDADTPIGDMVQLHLARVARRLADTPGLSAVPIDSLERLAEVENRARTEKIVFRYSQLITEAEVRGMHVQFHDQFKALLTTAIAKKLEAMPRPSTLN